MSGLSENDFDFLQDSFEKDELETNGDTFPMPGKLSAGINDSKLFKNVRDELIKNLKAQNTEKTTDRQTKWAVKLLKLKYGHPESVSPFTLSKA